MEQNSLSRDDEEAEMLLGYLNERPGAADTLMGIACWWWGRQAFEQAYRRVEAALEELVAPGAGNRGPPS